MTLKPQHSLAHYRLVEILGEGGMGVVWKAEDTKLGRHVALKVLPPERVGDEERRLRFLREARTAAAVNHPNIAAVHEIGEAGETIYIAMELVEGTTLRQRMAGGPLPMRETLRFSGEMAEALASAHRAGIVHRDLKPENVMVRPDGHTKILDFGLAKLRDPDLDTPASTRMETISAEMTREGKIFGTAAYMSPEQARGRKVDFRSDLFSFGVVLYEMITGVSPFQTDNVTDTLSSVVRDRPQSAVEINPEVPGELGRIVEKCLEKDAGERFQDTADLSVDLRKLRRTTDSQAVAHRTDSAPMAAAAAPLWRRPLALGLALVTVVAVAAVLMTQRSRLGAGANTGSAEQALAVMPFENLKQADDPERLGQILQELIITDLSDVEALGVFSSQRLYDVHNQITGTSERVIDSARITEVANRAGATTLLTGSLSQLGSRWILTGQLVDVSSGKVLQSERIDGDDLYRMVDELAGKIRADLVDAAAAAGIDRAVGERTTGSLEAYQAYLEASELFIQRHHTKADEKLVQALEIDPTFGQAMYLLAQVRGWQANPGKETTRELLEQLLEEGAFKLPDRQRLIARSSLAFQLDDFAESERLARQAVERYPDEKEAWYVLADTLYHMPEGDDDESMRLFDRALELDPAYEPAYEHIGDLYQRQGRWADMAEKVQGLVRREPHNPIWYIEWTKSLLQQDDADGAEEVLQEALRRVQDPQDRHRLLLGIAWEFIHVSRRDRAKELVNQALELEAPGGQDGLHDALSLIARRDRDWREAAEQARRALEIDPTSGAFWHLREVLDGQGRYGDIILLSRSVIAQAPDNLYLYRSWMVAALMVGDEAEAERAFNAALSRVDSDSGRSDVWEQRSNAYGAIGDEVRAHEYHKKAGELAESFPAHAFFWDYLRLGRLQEAESALRSASKTAKLAANEWLAGSFFWVLRDLGKTEEALQHAERWRKVRPTDNGAHEALIELHLMAGREAEAERALQAGLEVHPLPQNRADLLAKAAVCYHNAAQPERSEDLIREAISLVGDDAPDWFHRQLIDALLYQQRYEEAEAVLGQAMERHGGPPSISDVWAMIFLAAARRDTGEAARVALEQLDRHPLHRFTVWYAAVALTYNEEFARAEPLVRRVIAMRPDHLNHSVLAWILIAGDIDIDEGLAQAEKARTFPMQWHGPTHVAVEHWFPTVEHALGLGYLKQGRPEEAIPWLEEAARLQPKRTLVQEHLAEARR